MFLDIVKLIIDYINMLKIVANIIRLFYGNIIYTYLKFRRKLISQIDRPHILFWILHN